MAGFWNPTGSTARSCSAGSAASARPAWPAGCGIGTSATNIGASNGLLRQYFPKHTDLHEHDVHALARAARELNQRPRLVLGDRTPEEIMRDCRTTSIHH
jgi:hypothetical protein